MPQPLSKIRANARITFTPDALRDKPELAIAVTSIFAQSALIDHEFGMLLGRILKTDASAAIAMHAKLQTQHLQRATLDAAASVTLSEEEYSVFRAVTKATETAQAERHKLAHWIWGICVELPDSFVLVDPKHYKEKMLSTEAINRDSAQPLLEDLNVLDLLEIIKRQLFDYSQVLVYNIKDLNRIKRDLSEAALMFFLYRGYIEFPERRDEALPLLSKIRLFREALDHVKGKAEKNTPPVRS